MRELALHLMDIAENSVAARATRVEMDVVEDLAADRLWMAVRDNGVGMSEEMAARVIDPFVTSRTTRKVGLGIPLLKAAAEACEGGLEIHSALGQGTTLEVWFRHSHIDRMPLGDLAGTVLALEIGHPEINWVLQYQAAGRFEFDDQPVKQALEGVPLYEPAVLAYVRNMIEEGIAAASPATAPMDSQ